MACAVHDSDPLRFAVGGRVMCRSGGWAKGKMPGVRKGDWACGTVEKVPPPRHPGCRRHRSWTRVGEREGGGEQPTGSRGRDSDGEWLACARRRAARVPSSPRFLLRRHARPTCTASWGRNKTGPGRLLHPATRKRGLANDVRPYHARRSRCIAARQPPPCRCPGRCRWVTALG